MCVVCVCHFVFLTSIRNCGRSDALRPMLAIMRHLGKVTVGRWMICAIIYREAIITIIYREATIIYREAKAIITV